jgi:hypothetical protein
VSWSLAEDTPRLQRFFRVRFGRALPVSAFGQSPLHDRMEFDHGNALDVAVDPSSSDGQLSGLPAIRRHSVQRFMGDHPRRSLWRPHPRGPALSPAECMAMTLR